jgi:hypothetical protein
MLGWTLGNLLVALVEPPPVLARFMPKKVWFIFAFLPEPWDRRVGAMLNAVVGGVFIGWYGYYALRG